MFEISINQTPHTLNYGICFNSTSASSSMSTYDLYLYKIIKQKI